MCNEDQCDASYCSDVGEDIQDLCLNGHIKSGYGLV